MTHNNLFYIIIVVLLPQIFQRSCFTDGEIHNADFNKQKRSTTGVSINVSQILQELREKKKTIFVTNDKKNEARLIDFALSEDEAREIKELWCPSINESIEQNIPQHHCKCPEIDQYLKVESLCSKYTTNQCKNDNNDQNGFFKARVYSIALISIMGIIGNILVIVVRMKYWNASPHFQLIIGLSFADLTFSCIYLIETTGEIASPCTWIYGNAMCKILRSGLSVSSMVDLGFILIISLERYIGIAYPFNVRFSSMRTLLLICINVVLSCILVIPIFYQYNVSTTTGWCDLEFESQIVYTSVMFVCFFVLPVVITSLLSYRSVSALNKTMCEHNMLATMDERSRARLLSENVKIMRVLVFLLLAFVVLCLPNHLMWIIIESHGRYNFSTTAYASLTIFGSVPYSLHVAINPLIYSVLDKRFRMHLINLLRCRKSLMTADIYEFSRSRVETNEIDMSLIGDGGFQK